MIRFVRSYSHFVLVVLFSCILFAGTSAADSQVDSHSVESLFKDGDSAACANIKSDLHLWSQKLHACKMHLTQCKNVSEIYGHRSIDCEAFRDCEFDTKRVQNLIEERNTICPQ